MLNFNIWVVREAIEVRKTSKRKKKIWKKFMSRPLLFFPFTGVLKSRFYDTIYIIKVNRSELKKQESKLELIDF